MIKCLQFLKSFHLDGIKVWLEKKSEWSHNKMFHLNSELWTKCVQKKKAEVWFTFLFYKTVVHFVHFILLHNLCISLCFYNLVVWAGRKGWPQNFLNAFSICYACFNRFLSASTSQIKQHLNTNKYLWAWRILESWSTKIYLLMHYFRGILCRSFWHFATIHFFQKFKKAE